MSETRLRDGYFPESDTWVIYGVRYSGEALRALAEAKGEVYRINRVGDVVVLVRVGDGVDGNGT